LTPQEKYCWLLGTGITMFLIGSYMFVNWMLGLCILVCQQNMLEPGNFSFERLATGISIFYSCPSYWFNDPSCVSDLSAGDTVTLMHGIMWALWLAGIFLIVYSAAKLLSSRKHLLDMKR
jgi:hypothetical protein